LGPGPQFEVRRAVVVLNAVDVVNGFALDEVPAEDLLGDEDVLEEIPAAGARVTWNTLRQGGLLVALEAVLPAIGNESARRAATARARSSSVIGTKPGRRTTSG
jgi:hypothetical protein